MVSVTKKTLCPVVKGAIHIRQNPLDAELSWCTIISQTRPYWLLQRLDWPLGKTLSYNGG